MSKVGRELAIQPPAGADCLQRNEGRRVRTGALHTRNQKRIVFQLHSKDRDRGRHIALPAVMPISSTSQCNRGDDYGIF